MFIFKKTFGSSVIGVDLSTNMVGIAYERLLGMPANKLKVKISFLLFHLNIENIFSGII
jgi:hypothetical protein